MDRVVDINWTSLRSHSGIVSSLVLLTIPIKQAVNMFFSAEYVLHQVSGICILEAGNTPYSNCDTSSTTVCFFTHVLCGKNLAFKAIVLFVRLSDHSVALVNPTNASEHIAKYLPSTGQRETFTSSRTTDVDGHSSSAKCQPLAYRTTYALPSI